MSPKTKTQLRAQLEQAQRELVEVQAKNLGWGEGSKREAARWMATQERVEMCQRAIESERELNEVITELSLEQYKVESLQALWEAWLSEEQLHSHTDATAWGMYAQASRLVFTPNA